ncbi:MAG: hypothetical protein FJY55_04235 [Betaproteobacteria bacterium]|nr:hypothetical protein [Betaproteobacteria bacterium]
MNRSESVIRRLAGHVLAVLLLAAGSLVQAQTQYQAGREYLRLDPPRPVATGSRIEVLEFFYYGCPVCYELQPHLSRWIYQAPDYVSLQRVPVLSSETGSPSPSSTTRSISSSTSAACTSRSMTISISTASS